MAYATKNAKKKDSGKKKKKSCRPKRSALGVKRRGGRGGRGNAPKTKSRIGAAPAGDDGGLGGG